MAEKVAIMVGDLIEYRDASHTFHVKALGGVEGGRVRVRSTLNRKFVYGIDVSMIVSVQRVGRGSTAIVYQREVST